MSAFSVLLKLDYLAFRDWFGKQTLSKIIVSLAYLLILVAVTGGVYFWSNAFFKYVISYESFGLLTSTYILRGAFALLLWIGILSSMISTLTFLLSSNRDTDLMVTYPISSLTLSLHAGFKSTLINLSLLTISVFPLILAFSHQLSGSIATLLIMVLFTQSLGQSLGYFLSLVIHGKYGRLIGLSIGALLLGFTIVILRTIFPPELKMLNDLPSESFTAFFNELPLIKNFWIGNSLLSLLSGQLFASAPLVIFTVGLIIFSIITQATLFIPCWQAQKDYSSSHVKPAPSLGKIKNLSLITKDLLSIVRNSKNLSYLLFLISMIIAFFGLFGQGYLARSVPDRFRFDSLVFSFVWLIFFTGTYLIRLTYPLGVNEGRSRWWFFTLPITTSRALASKVAVSITISTPLIFLAFIEWHTLPFAVSPGFFDIFSFLAIVLLAVTLPLFGFLNPDYNLAYQPERASTSLSGLVSIVFVSIVGALGAYLITASLKQLLGPGVAINGFFVFCLITSIGAWSLAHRYLSSFSFEL